jgi:DNA-binding response OmpR family regulator/anti-sigma regulatory factor (Ser/Thr protein kinase)
MKNNLELERINYEKNNEISTIKQQFFTNVSHDIRTPVTLILGAINKMIRNNEISHSALNGSLGIVKKNCNHLVHLVNQLLDYENSEPKRLNVTRGDFVKFSKEIYLSFTEMASQKKIDFSFHSTASTIELWFDNNEMEKVLYNLLANAFKFSESGGSIEIALSETDSTVQLECKDNGVGISNNDVLKIFNRFYKKSNSKNAKYQSWGLGLSITKEIIERHHGTISVKSKMGDGSNFTIHLNKGNAHFKEEDIDLKDVSGEGIENYFVDKFEELNNQQPQNINDNAHILKPTILIVEDNIEIRNYIVDLLKKDFEIMVAANGKEALILATSKLPDIIISDVMMPLMDGITLTRQLKSDINTSHIPVILLTARTSMINKIEGFDIGADDYILKPFNESLLISRIKNVLRNRQLLHAKFTAKDIIPLSELSLNKADETFMKKLVAVIDSNISSTDLSAQFVCNAIGMSHSVMYKKLKGLTNMTYVEFVRDYKLKTAKKLLTDHNFSVLDAAYHVGYSDRKYFSKRFKAHFGKVPSHYVSKAK